MSDRDTDIVRTNQRFDALASGPLVRRCVERLVQLSTGEQYVVRVDALNPYAAYSGDRTAQLPLEYKQHILEITDSSPRAVGYLVGYVALAKGFSVHFAIAHGVFHQNLKDAIRVAYNPRQADEACDNGVRVSTTIETGVIRIVSTHDPKYDTYDILTPLDKQTAAETRRIEVIGCQIVAAASGVIDRVAYQLVHEAQRDQDWLLPGRSCGVTFRNDVWNLAY